MILVFNNFQFFFIVCYSQWTQFDSDDNSITILIASRIFIFLIVTWVNCCLIVVCVAIITIQWQNLATFVDTCWISVGLLPPSITFQRNQKVHHSVDLLGILWAIPCHSHHLILSHGIHPITCQAAMASEDGSMGRSLSSTFFLRSHGIQNSMIWRFGQIKAPKCLSSKMPLGTAHGASHPEEHQVISGGHNPHGKPTSRQLILEASIQRMLLHKTTNTMIQ